MALIGDNYGTLNGMGGGVRSATSSKGQVYQITHDSYGNSLTFLRRSFISFSFGGKNIEDFDLLAYCEGDSMSRELSAEFEDLTSSYNILDGETYLGTHFKPYKLTLNLVSDGIEEKQLEAFRHWFRGGQVRELILAEHPNRAIMARVQSPPKMQMIPYEKVVSRKISSTPYSTSTTLYKGKIEITFVSEAPFWYSKQNIIGESSGGTFYADMWHGKSIRNDEDTRKDVLKIIYEDGVPLLSMVNDTMYFGGDQYAKVKTENYNIIVQPYPNQHESGLVEGPGLFKISGVWYQGAKIEDLSLTPPAYGRIAGSIADTTGNGIDLAPSETYYFYYPGTAPAPLKIKFSIPLRLNASGYVTSINNSIIGSNPTYNTITIQSQHIKTLTFTTPNIISSYNKAMKYINSAAANYWGDLSDTITDAIRHPAVRESALAIIQYYWNNTSATIIGENDVTNMRRMFSQFWWTNYAAQFGGANVSQPQTIDATPCFGASFEFDAYTGVSYGTFSYNVISRYTGQLQVDKVENSKENVGDMLRSNYIQLEDRNVLTEDGYVAHWSDNDTTASHKLVHDLPVAMTNFKLEYRTMYL